MESKIWSELIQLGDHLYYYLFRVELLILAVLTFVAYLYITGFRLGRFIKQMRLYYRVRHIFKAAKSWNHKQTLLAKYLMGLEIKQDEDEQETYKTLVEGFGKDDWPFMMQQRSDKAGDIYVNNKPVKHISSYSYLDLAHREDVIEAGCQAA